MAWHHLRPPGDAESYPAHMDRLLNSSYRVLLYDELEQYQSVISRLTNVIANYGRAIENQPSDPTFHRCRAFLYVKTDRHLDSIRDFTAAIELDPSFKRTFVDRSAAYARIGEHELAARDLALSKCAE
jgi:tetratricopeptide (TPR) repeat protein